MGKVIGATVNIFFSLLLGAVALGVVAVQFPQAVEVMLEGASWVRNQLTHTGLDPKYNVWLLFLIAEQQLLFMAFVIAVRIVLAVLMTAGSRLFNGGYR